MPVDPMQRIQQARQQLKVRQMLAQQQLEGASLQHKQEVEKLRLQAQVANEQAEGQLKSAEEQIRAKQQAQQQAQRGQAQQAQAAQDQANAPILREPQAIDGNRPDLATMPQVGPSQLSVVQPPSQGVPSTQGQPAMGGGSLGPLAPYLEHMTQTEGTARGRFGTIPAHTTTYERQPNVLKAYEYAQLQSQVSATRAKDRDTYLDQLANIGHYAKTPGARQVLARELERLVQTDPNAVLELERRMGALEGSDAKHGLENPREVWDPRSPTGTTLAAGNEAVGKPGLRLESARTHGAAEGGALGQALSGALARLMPTGPSTNNLQERQINATNALARTRGIYRNWDPAYLTVPTQLMAGGANMAEKLGMSLNPEISQKVAGYNRFKQDVSENLTATIYEWTGKQINEREADRMKNIVLTMEDGPSAGKSKLDNFYTKQLLVTARNQYLLLNGLGTRSIGEALQQLPELQLDMSPPGVADPGADRILEIMDRAQTQAEMAIRAEAAKQGITLKPGLVQGKAVEMIAPQFNLSPEDLQFLMQQ